MSHAGSPNRLAHGVTILFMALTAAFAGLWGYTLEQKSALEDQLEQRTPRIDAVDISQPIVDEKDPFVRLKSVMWKDDKGLYQHLVCGDRDHILFKDRDGHVLAAVFPPIN